MNKPLTIRYQLIRAKSGNYKKMDSQPSLIEVDVFNPMGKKGEKIETKKVQEMEIINKDYPLRMPVILYSQDKLRQVEAGQPFLTHNTELYAIYNFTQLEIDESNPDFDEIVINIWVMYVAPAKNSQLAKVD